MLFIFMLKTFSFLRFLKFCPDFFLHVGKWRDKKDQVNFKIFDLVTKYGRLVACNIGALQKPRRK